MTNELGGQVTHQVRDGALVVRLAGEVDTLLRRDASDAIAALLNSTGDVTVVASDVTFIDSSGVAFLLQLHRLCTEQGRRFALLDPAPRVQELLELIALEDLIPIERSA